MRPIVERSRPACADLMMKFLLPIVVVGGIFALLFLLERLFPLRASTRSLFRRLVVNLAISALTFGCDYPAAPSAAVSHQHSPRPPQT